MSFSQSVKDKVMNASARHCCVCHRYKGVKIELHHIDPKRLFGKNTFENAIPLCYDCHSDAGHYFAQHPKGTKYSPEELKGARQIWYDFVKNNPIVEKLVISEHIQTSYYVLQSFDVVMEILLNGDFSSLNKFRQKTYLSTNEVSNTWKIILQSHNQDYGVSKDQTHLIQYRQFNSFEEYQKIYKNYKLIDKSSDDHPYYEAKRELSWNELLNTIEPNSFLKLLFTSGVQINDCCQSYLYKNGPSCCGETPETGYTEYIEIAPISFVFMGITNVSDEQIKLNYLEGIKSIDDQALIKMTLPNFTLLPYEMVLIPVSTNLNVRIKGDEQILLDLRRGDRGQEFSRVLNILNPAKKNMTFIGNRLIVKSLFYNNNKGAYEIPIHELDFNNLYSINRIWLCGCCPHLFFILENGKPIYQREILKNYSSIIGTEEILIPADVKKIMVIELEAEITNILSLLRNNKLIIKDTILQKGDKLLINVDEGDKIRINGKYTPFNKSYDDISDKWFRNKIIENFNRLSNHI